MTLFALLLFAPPSRAAQEFDACIAAHRRAPAVSVAIQSNTRAKGVAFHNRYNLKFRRPDKMLLRTMAVNDHGQISTDRTFFIDGLKLIGIDTSTSETLTRTAPTAGLLSERAAYFLGALDDSVRFQLSTEEMSRFFADFRKLDGWKYKFGGTLKVLTRTQAGKSNVRFEFTRGDMLKSVRISAPGSLLDWHFDYATQPTSLTLAIPSNFRKVTAFSNTPVSKVKFASRAASKIWDACIAAYGALRSASMTVTAPKGVTRVMFDGGKATQRDKNFAWAYDGAVLSIRRGNTLQRGKCSSGDIGKYVLDSIDPILQAWSQHKNPARVLTAHKASARIAGVVVVDGVPCDLIEFKVYKLLISVLVRRTDHLFARVTSRTLDNRRAAVSTTDRAYRYGSVNRKLGEAWFRLEPSPGQKVVKLP